jgi:hypothetical protein
MTCPNIEKETMIATDSCALQTFTQELTTTNRPNKIWMDNAIRCCDKRIDDETYDMIVCTSTDEQGWNFVAKYFGANRKLVNLLVGNNESQFRIAVSQLVERLTVQGIAPSSVVILRDAKLALESSPLCANCGGSYLTAAQERVFDTVLVEAGFEVKIVSCE